MVLRVEPGHPSRLQHSELLPQEEGGHDGGDGLAVDGPDGRRLEGAPAAGPPQAKLDGQQIDPLALRLMQVVAAGHDRLVQLLGRRAAATDDDHGVAAVLLGDAEGPDLDGAQRPLLVK